MREPSPAAAGGVAALAVIALAMPWAGASSWLFVAVEMLLMVDLVDGTLRLLLARRPSTRTLDAYSRVAADTGFDGYRPGNFAILMAVHNLESEIDLFLKRFHTLKSVTWLIDDASTDGTFEYLRRSGWRVARNPTNTKKPGAIKRLLATLPDTIDTVVVSDPDVELVSHERDARQFVSIVRRFQQCTLDAICPRVDVQPESVIDSLQDLEYILGFRLGRASLGTQATTSGVAIYKRRALEVALSSHSLSVYAEDLENAATLLSRGGRVMYVDDLVFHTQAKQSLGALFSQRAGWAYGLARVLSNNAAAFRRIGEQGLMAFYQYRVYLHVLGFVVFPLRLAAVGLAAASVLNGVEDLLFVDFVPNALMISPTLFAEAYLKYTLLTALLIVLVSPRSALLRHLLVAPLYLPYNVILAIPIAVGYANWITRTLFNIKLYHDHYDEERA